MYFTNIAALRALPALPTPMEEFVVGGHYAEGDGGGGTFTWVPKVSPPADDGGIIIRPNSGGPINGYYKRIYSGPINVRWFGAIMKLPDGTVQNTDVTTQVHAARDSQFAQQGSLYFPEDIIPSTGATIPYVGAFDFPDNHGHWTLLGDGTGSVLQYNNSGDPVLSLGISFAVSRSNSRVFNLVVDGVDPTSGSVGVSFRDSSGSYVNTMFAGSWVFEKVTFRNCDKGVYKPTGNINNAFWTVCSN